MLTKKFSILTVSLIVFLFSHCAFSAGFSIGPKFGNINFESSRFSGDSGLGIQAGFMFNESWSIDFEYLMADTEFEPLSSDIDFNTTALYAAYRARGKGYFLAKAGLLRTDFDFLGGDTDASIGIGGGVRFNNLVSLEGEISHTVDNITFVGATLRFTFY